MSWHEAGETVRNAMPARAGWLRPHGKLAFLKSLPPGAKVLDVGCGNNSPRDAKILRPDLVYTGLDVEDYNQHDSVHYANAHVLVRPAEFAVRSALTPARWTL